VRIVIIVRIVTIVSAISAYSTHNYYMVWLWQGKLFFGAKVIFYFACVGKLNF